MKKVAFIYLDLNNELSIAANTIRELINVADKNRSISVIDQKRYGLNYEGNYYHFECFGLNIILALNDDDDYKNCNYYLEIQSELKYEKEVFEGVISHLESLLKRSNIQYVVEM